MCGAPAGADQLCVRLLTLQVEPDGGGDVVRHGAGGGGGGLRAADRRLSRLARLGEVKSERRVPVPPLIRPGALVLGFDVQSLQLREDG